jgi:hypothetical protein
MANWSPRFAAIIAFSLAMPLRAGDFWTKKPYQSWSADEAQHILQESPWATTLTLAGIQTNITSGDSPNNPRYRGEMETSPSISYNLQFRSARPIREAEVRSSELNSHYEKMTPEQRAVFDANAGKFLMATFPDRVLISITFHATVQNDDSLLRNYWASQSLAKLSMSVFLNTRKERLSLLSYGFKDSTFQFTFPRPKDLQPNERISVEFVHPRINSIGQQRILQDFSLKKMMVNGQLEF